MTDTDTTNQNFVSEEVLRSIAKLDYEAYLSESNDRLRYQTEFSQSALKSLMLVNGGAIISLLTFIGNKGHVFDQEAIWWSFLLFALGLFFCLVAYFGAYFSQGYYMQMVVNQTYNAQRRMHGYQETYNIDRDLKIGNIAIWFAIISTVISLFLFVGGSFFALRSIL